MANGTPGPQVVVPGAGWVDIATKAITQVGFPVVIAGVLLWFLLTKFQDNMNMITGRMAANTEAAGTLVEMQKTVVAEEQGQSRALQEIAATLRVLAGQRQIPPPPPPQ